MAREMRPKAKDSCVYMPLAREEGSAEIVDTDVEPFDSDVDWTEVRWQEPRQGGKLLGTMVGVLSVVGAVSTVLFVMVLPQPQSARDKGNADESIEKLGGFTMGNTLADTFGSMSSVLSGMEKSYPEVQKMGTPVQIIAHETMVGGQNFLPNLTKYHNITGTVLNNPQNDKSDGNLCPDGEEMHGYLCYKKCYDLTKGKYPIRTSAFACCANWPCSFFNSVFSNPLNFCDGYDVAGDKQQSGCPHGPGDCFENEEFSLGMCYKKCAILTDNAFPYRAAAASCCRYNNHLACLDALNMITNASLNVGGGKDGTLSQFSHQPKLGLTEKKSHYTSDS